MPLNTWYITHCTFFFFFLAFFSGFIDSTAEECDRKQGKRGGSDTLQRDLGQESNPHVKIYRGSTTVSHTNLNEA